MQHGPWAPSIGLLLALSAAPLAQGPGPSGEERPLFRLRSAAPDLVILEWDRPALRRVARPGARLHVGGFPLGDGAPVELELEAFSVTGPGTRFVRGRRGLPDEPVEFDPSAIALLRGRVVDRPGSHVFLALSERGATGFIDPGAGRPLHRLSSRGRSGRDLPPGHTSVFQAGAPMSRPPDVPLCGVARGGAAPARETAAASGPRTGLKHLELAVETDHEYFSLFGDTTAALTYLVEMYAQVSDIYIRDVDTRVEIVFARIWDDPDDLFNVVDPSPLPDFRNYWNANMGSVVRDAAQLLSGRRDYPFGGQATLSALCGAGAYSVVGYAMGFFPDPTEASPYSYDVSVTAHELGHNAGTGHTQDNGIDTCNDPLSSPQRGTIMAYCGQTWSGGNANRDHYFHSIIQANMDAHIGSVSCVVDDCNRNSIADAQDISGATSLDLNLNEVPDECEDCNGNSTRDDVDILGGTSLDVDGDGVPDECQPDCNGNDVPDSRDIADGTSLDAYGNDIPDECETDCDGDGTSDYTEIQSDMSLDLDRSRGLDACQDCDADGTTDLEALGAAHRAWVASGLSSTPLREFHGVSGVETRTSGGGGGSRVDGGQDLIAAPGGRILVTSSGDSRVLEFATDGTYVGDLVAPGAGGLSAPTGLALIPGGGTLLVASAGTDSVLAFDLASGAPQGTFVASGAGGLLEPFGLAFGPSGHLFVTSAADEILEFDGTSGALVGPFVPAANNGGLEQPRGLAFKPDGNLLVASFGTDEVLEYDGTSGAPLGKWAVSGTSSVITQTSPWGIRIGPNGNVFVSRTGAAFGSGGGGGHDHGHLHLTHAQLYEFDVRNGNFVRAYVSGNDQTLEFPTGFDFVPGWETDCNLNMLPDGCDIAQGLSADADADDVPDECQVDCDGNGTWDRLDLIPYGTARDCNSNGVPDPCDTASGASADCTGDGVPDECEADCNGNGIADSCDVLSGALEDCDANGILDDCDVADDLEVDSGWTAGVPGDTATTGAWTRVDPNGTAAQPADDHTATGRFCFVTGQGTPGGGVGENDVDGGTTTLLSPPLDLSGRVDPEIGYWRWFSNSAGSNPGEDVLTVDISGDGGGSWTALETVGPTGAQASGGWFLHRFRVADFVTPTSQVVLRFIASDLGGGSIVEAAVDDLILLPRCCSPPPEVEDLTLGLDGSAGWTAQPAVAYDVAGGVVSDGGTDAAACLAEDETAATWEDPRPAPVLGDAYYYLVRPQGTCGRGTYGTDSAGRERAPVTDCS